MQLARIVSKKRGAARGSRHVDAPTGAAGAGMTRRGAGAGVVEAPVGASPGAGYFEPIFGLHTELRVSEPDDALEVEANVAADRIMRLPAAEAGATTDPHRVGKGVRRGGSRGRARRAGFVRGRRWTDRHGRSWNHDSGTASPMCGCTRTHGRRNRRVPWVRWRIPPGTTSHLRRGGTLPGGDRLLAHELAHVVQQAAPGRAGAGTGLMRQVDPGVERWSSAASWRRRRARGVRGVRARHLWTRAMPEGTTASRRRHSPVIALRMAG